MSPLRRTIKSQEAPAAPSDEWFVNPILAESGIPPFGLRRTLPRIDFSFRAAWRNKMDMSSLLKTCLFLLAVEGAFAADLANFGGVNTFSTDCLVTKVQATDESVFIEFRGRWQSDAPLARFADTDQNALDLARKAGDEKEWNGIVGAAKAALNHKATITVKSPGWLMRGGIPRFHVPPAKVEITVAPEPVMIEGAEKLIRILMLEDIGASIQVPDDWTVDSGDTFGHVIRPAGEEKVKVRIHLTSHKNVSSKEAVQSSADRIDEIRRERGHPPEQIISSSTIQTTSGIKGQKAVVGQQGIDGPPYLTRYYFEGRGGRIFCVCVYHYGDAAFSGKAERIIMETLALAK